MLQQLDGPSSVECLLWPAMSARSFGVAWPAAGCKLRILEGRGWFSFNSAFFNKICVAGPYLIGGLGDFSWSNKLKYLY